MADACSLSPDTLCVITISFHSLDAEWALVNEGISHTSWNGYPVQGIPVYPGVLIWQKEVRKSHCFPYKSLRGISGKPISRAEILQSSLTSQSYPKSHYG